MTIIFILQAALNCKSSILIVIHNQNRFCFLYLAIVCYQSFSFFDIIIMIVLIGLDSSCHYSIIFCRCNKITRVYYSFTITIIVTMALEAHQISNTMQWDISHLLWKSLSLSFIRGPEMVLVVLLFVRFHFDLVLLCTIVPPLCQRLVFHIVPRRHRLPLQYNTLSHFP